MLINIILNITVVKCKQPFIIILTHLLLGLSDLTFTIILIKIYIIIHILVKK